MPFSLALLSLASLSLPIPCQGETRPPWRETSLLSFHTLSQGAVVHAMTSAWMMLKAGWWLPGPYCSSDFSSGARTPPLRYPLSVSKKSQMHYGQDRTHNDPPLLSYQLPISLSPPTHHGTMIFPVLQGASLTPPALSQPSTTNI